MKKHKSGFVNIIGRPNVGKSTLMNTLVGERMSIITFKPQTTRHRIIGIVSDEDYQIVFSDTPGIIKDPAYKMHQAMNSFVEGTFEDGDIMLFLTTPEEKYEDDDPIIEKLKKVEVPLFLVLNKVDISTPPELIKLIQLWNNSFFVFLHVTEHSKRFHVTGSVKAVRLKDFDEFFAVKL